MDLGVEGKVALVLAASKGLGRACAFSLAREGARVVIGARDAAALERTAEELRAQTHAEIRAFPVDVGDAAASEAFVRRAREAFGPVDIVVTNSGGPPFGPFASFDEEQWDGAYRQNLLAIVRLIRLVLPEMQQRGWGRIVNIISGSVKSVLDRSVLSTAMRLGVVGMAKLLADEVAADGITVNNVAPGSILSDRVREVRLTPLLEQGLSEDEAVARLGATIPMKRIGLPEELGDLVAFLASDRAAYITGVTIPIDGGIGRAIA
jgi:3-oxoacyl-[acyl-carrier protein] reductase